jgi:23S rRNA (uracil1939-C5)-methyltransferase
MMAIEPGTGIQRIGMRLGEDRDVQITLESTSGEIPEFIAEDLNASVVHLKDDSRVVLAGSEYIWMSILGRKYRVWAGTFFQVNARVAEKMVETVLSDLPGKKDLNILEVYCGAGLFSAFLAREVAKLVAIESSAQACEDFCYNLDEFDNIELYEAAAEIVIPALTLHPDMVLVDPPRNGLLCPVIQGLLKMRAQQIIYVSCDPATLARDARYLVEGGYELTRVIPFDMFPQTYHIESISSWILRT